MFEQNSDLNQFLFFGTGQPSRSGFWSNIDDFLELYRKNKTENRKSCSNKLLGIPKAVQNRSEHSLKVPELGATLAWSCRNFRKFQDLDQILKISMFFNQNFRFSGNLHEKYFWPKNIFDLEKKSFFSELGKKLGHSFDVESWELSISEVFRVIPALCREIDTNMCQQNFLDSIYQ